MSFGISIGDLIAIGTLASQLSNALRGAAPEFQDCASLCDDVSLVIQACTTNRTNSPLLKQDIKTIVLLNTSCNTTLAALQTLLRRYESLGSTSHRVRDTLGFAYAKGDCDRLRRRLGEHLLVINTFLTGSPVSAPDSSSDELTPELFFALFSILHEEKLKPAQAGGLLSLDIEDDSNWATVRAFVITKADFSGDYLDQKKPYVKSCIKRIAKDQSKASAAEASVGGEALVAAQKENEELPIATPQRWVISPAKSKGKYNPRDNPWYTSIGRNWLQKVQVGFDVVIEQPPCVWGYSEDEAWLCLLPEGWSRTPTMLKRRTVLQQAYYYCFNNLSCEPGNRPKTSRAYFAYCPFSDDESDSDINRDGWNAICVPGRYSFVWQHVGATQTRSVPPSTARFHGVFVLGQGLPQQFGCVGFMSMLDRLPWDLDDEVSKNLVELLIGPNGLPVAADQDTIIESLPEEWLASRNDHARITYINTEEEWNSTVHPARFTDPDSEISNQLPEGWDRRLDSWGNLFFVDHHTKSATREDPRFNQKVNRETGLPMGWRAIKDHTGKEFFFQRKGKMIIGTYDPSTMPKKDLHSKNFLSREPAEGEKPEISRAGQNLTGRKAHSKSVAPAATTMKATSPAIDPLEVAPPPVLPAHGIGTAIRTSPSNVSSVPAPPADAPPMPTDEKVKYFTMFDEAPKADKWTITLEEALEQTKSFDLPVDIVKEIWERSDTNHDQRWDMGEYANAMHDIMIAISKQETLLQRQPPESATPAVGQEAGTTTCQAPLAEPTQQPEITSSEDQTTKNAGVEIAVQSLSLQS